MKKKLLTLGLFVAMLLGTFQIKVTNANEKVLCLNYHNYECGFTAMVCGSTFNQMQEMADEWDSILCD